MRRSRLRFISVLRACDRIRVVYWVDVGVLLAIGGWWPYPSCFLFVSCVHEVMVIDTYEVNGEMRLRNDD